MTHLEAAVLGTVQGLTEFLPISSSAHLFVIPTVLGWPYAGLAFDAVIHWGTLLALLIAYWRDWVSLVRDLFAADPVARREAVVTWLKLAAASVPAAIGGLLLQDTAATLLRSLPLQAVTLVVFGFLLWWVDRVRPADRDAAIPGWGTCLLVGCAQAIALVPGVSRSGVTITAGRAARLTRVAAARFSFLLATPITFGAGLVELKHVSPDLPISMLLVGVVTAAVSGILAIRILVAWVGRAGFGAFFAYRVALALVIVAFIIRR
jgi:undecaprenyl-diphosphatase